MSFVGSLRFMRRSKCVEFVELVSFLLPVQALIADMNGPCGKRIRTVNNASNETVARILFSRALLSLYFHFTSYFFLFIGQNSGHPVGVMQSRMMCESIPAVKAAPIVISKNK
ncbi:hypothetical protein MTTB_p140 (plasmid) [Methanothermobacter tenebrarum]|uniref:Secreted protein n=1 Tax=Methanothermobacter tenebrarum TaxID=680118 RepID=A0ABM7YFV3_9EURY|nr:hypothetical protein MTTB_p140 [Methanothermobacter tenebrarum]